MKKAISILISAILLAGMLVSAVSSGAVYQLKDSIKYEPNRIIVFPKQKYKRGTYTAKDFPELELESVESHTPENSVFPGTVRLCLPKDSGLSLQEAMERVAKNPMVASVMPDITEPYVDLCWILPGDANGDETINARDITTIMKYLLNNEEMILNERHTHSNYLAHSRIDANNDGAVDAKDITWIMEELVGKHAFY